MTEGANTLRQKYPGLTEEEAENIETNLRELRLRATGPFPVDYDPRTEAQKAADARKYDLLTGVNVPRLDDLLIRSALATSGTKHDQGKPMMSLVPQHALLEVAKVATFGAQKYGPHNWRGTADLERRYTDAALRHINAYLKGETHDAETELHHLSHAVCSLMFVLEHELIKHGPTDAAP